MRSNILLNLYLSDLTHFLHNVFLYFSCLTCSPHAVGSQVSISINNKVHQVIWSCKGSSTINVWTDRAGHKFTLKIHRENKLIHKKQEVLYSRWLTFRQLKTSLRVQTGNKINVEHTGSDVVSRSRSTSQIITNIQLTSLRYKVCRGQQGCVR